MKKGLTRIGLVVGVVALCLVCVGQTMPMQGLSPAQIADILMQPTYNEITAMKADLVNGVITVEQWEAQMYGLKVRLGVQRVILEAVRDSYMTYDQKIEALLAVYPWNIRGGI